MRKKNIFLTGLPGIGKTTLFKELYSRLESFHPEGFYTQELREDGVRKGFELISLDGYGMILSHKDIVSEYRVGQYKVDVSGFEKFLEKARFFDPKIFLIMIDEVGKMECLSGKFKGTMEKILNSEKIVIATIALRAGGFIRDLKNRDDVRIFEITRANRNSILPEIVDEVKALLG